MPLPISSGSGNATTDVQTQTAHSFLVGDVVYHNGSTWLKASAAIGTSIAQAVVSQVITANSFKVVYSGILTATAHGKTIGEYYYLDQTVAGTTTATAPLTGIVQQIYHVKDANTLLIDISSAFEAGSVTSLETSQTLASSGSVTITAWNSIVFIPDLTGNLTINYPATLGNEGKTIKLVKIQGSNGFTITHVANGVDNIFVANDYQEVDDVYGSMIIQVTESDTARQIASSPITATTNLAYGRVNISTDLAGVVFTNANNGVKIPFNNIKYTSGVNIIGTDIMYPPITGRYRVSWLMQAGSGEFAGNGYFVVIQNNNFIDRVFYDMMEAAGVNQCAGFIDVDLTGGLPVELRYQSSTTTDTIAWQTGSYFQLDQLPTAIAPVVNTIAEYGEENLSVDFVPTVAFTQMTGMSINLPSAGTYRIRYDATVFVTHNADTTRIFYARLYDSTNAIAVPNSISTIGGIDSEQSGFTTTNYFSGGFEVNYTVSGATTIELQGTVSALPSGTFNFRAATTTTGGTKFSWAKIAGNLPATGSTVDYGYFVPTIDTDVTAVADLSMSNSWISSSGNIPINSSGVISLSAGKTYKLEAGISNVDPGPSTITYQFVDAFTNVAIGPNQPLFSAIPVTSGGNLTTVPGSFIYTPSANQAIKIRVLSSNGAATIEAVGDSATWKAGTYIAVTQLGSTSNTVGTLPALDQSSTGYFDIGNMRLQWGTFVQGSGSQTVNLPMPFANANYTVTGNDNTSVTTNAVRGTSFSNKTTITFDTITNNYNGVSVAQATGNTIGYFAVGQKP